MTTKEETKAPAKTTTDTGIPDRVVTLAGKFKEHFKVTSSGVIETPADIYAQTLPKGLSMDIVQKVQNHDRDVVAAVKLATGELGMPFLAKHTKVDQVQVEFDGGQNHFGEVLMRKKDVPDGKGGTKTKYGHMRSFFEAGADEKSGLRPVDNHLRQLALDLLGE